MIGAIVLGSVFALLIIFWVILVIYVRKQQITDFDEMGISTRAGKYYLWSDLQEVKYLTMKKKLDTTIKRIRSLIFVFSGGIARVPYMAKNADSLIDKANSLHVKKTEKFIGYFIFDENRHKKLEIT